MTTAKCMEANNRILLDRKVIKISSATLPEPEWKKLERYLPRILHDPDLVHLMVNVSVFISTDLASLMFDSPASVYTVDISIDPVDINTVVPEPDDQEDQADPPCSWCL